jgi:hypothetical protein
MGWRRLRWRVLFGALCWLIAGVGAQADESSRSARVPTGIQIDVEFRGGGRLERARVWVSDRRIRIEQQTPALRRASHVLIYRGDEDRFLSLDPRTRAYVEVDRELIVAAGTPSLAARREVDGQLGRLPRAQHAALERLLGVREDGAVVAESPVRIRDVDGTDHVGEFSCRKRELVRGSVRLAELCVTEWSAVGIGPADLEVFRQLANFQRELMGSRDLTPLELVPNQPLDLLVQFDGFPLYLRGIDGSPLRGEVRVTSLRRIAATSDLFGIPSDYTARSAYSVFLGLAEGPAAPAPH